MEDILQQHIINTRAMRMSLSALFKNDIQEVTSKLLLTGHSFSAYKATIADENKQKRDIFVKKVLDDSYHNFYEEILSQHNLYSPKIFGTISVDGSLFLVMEFIPHEPAEWENKKRFKQAVEWLIEKDTIAYNNLTKLATCSCVHKSLKDHVDNFLDIIRKGAELHVHPLLTIRYSNMLFSKSRYFHQIHSSLSQKRQTINHNDFQMFNILFSTNEKKGNIYVVDWSGPSIGSVCVDLAKLMRVAPKRFHAYLLEIYCSQITFEGFADVFKAAQIHTNLLIFTWMVEMLIDKRGNIVSLPQFLTIAKELQDC